MPSYLVPAAGPDTVAHIEIRRSVFLAVVRRVETEADARALVAELRKAHHDARHHCSAFVIGPDRNLQRSSDDGEPAGTAGMPMLEVLRGFGEPDCRLSDVAAVVVRWFGGTLLGAGGLVRAYSDAVAKALSGSTFVRREQRILASTALPHADAGRVESELRAAGVQVLGTDYGASAVLRLATTDPDALARRLAAVTGGTASLNITGSQWIDLPPDTAPTAD